jgi:hypothetical protein
MLGVVMRRRVLLISVSAAACLSAAAVYTLASGTTDDVISVPVPSARVAAYCADLHAHLPREVNGLPRHDLKPASDLIAGWGDPAIVLRCGVPRPAVDGDYTTPAAEINGVDWSFEQLPGGEVRMTTTLRRAYVEVTFPEKYAHDAAPLMDLAPAVKRAIPEGIA